MEVDPQLIRARPPPLLVDWLRGTVVLRRQDRRLHLAPPCQFLAGELVVRASVAVGVLTWRSVLEPHVFEVTPVLDNGLGPVVDHRAGTHPHLVPTASDAVVAHLDEVQPAVVGCEVRESGHARVAIALGKEAAAALAVRRAWLAIVPQSWCAPRAPDRLVDRAEQSLPLKPSARAVGPVVALVRRVVAHPRPVFEHGFLELVVDAPRVAIGVIRAEALPVGIVPGDL